MSGLRHQYQQLAMRVNRVVLRERLLLLLVLLVVIYAFWALFFLFPQNKGINLAKIEEAALTKQVAQLRQKIMDVENTAGKLSADTKTVSLLTESEFASRSMVIPMFKSLVTQQSGIALKELLNLQDRPLSSLPNLEEAKLATPLYIQGTKIIIEGNYIAIYKYLQTLENLKWLLFWDELQYTVTQYPDAEMQLTLYTLSKTKED